MCQSHIGVGKGCVAGGEACVASSSPRSLLQRHWPLEHSSHGPASGPSADFSRLSVVKTLVLVPVLVLKDLRPGRPHSAGPTAAVDHPTLLWNVFSVLPSRQTPSAPAGLCSSLAFSVRPTASHPRHPNSPDLAILLK